MWIVCNNSFTFAFTEELQKATVKSNTSPQVCCRTTLEKLSAQLCSFAAKLVNSKAMQNRLIITNIYPQRCEVLVPMSTLINFRILQRVFKISAISMHA